MREPEEVLPGVRELGLHRGVAKLYGLSGWLFDALATSWEACGGGVTVP